MLQKMKEDCRNINDEYDFFDLLIAHTGSYISRNKFLYWFDWLWEYIPPKHLYEPYTDLLSDIHVIKGREYYSVFFQQEMLDRIKKHNRHDTVENPKLNALLDENGYLTVYLGHSKKTLRNCNSWALEKEQAINLGRIKALFDQDPPDFICVTGKVKLEDVVAHINVRGRDEVVVLQRDVKFKKKESLITADVELPIWWTWWG